MLADGDFKIATGVDFQGIAVQEAGFYLGEILGVAATAGSHAEVVHRAPVAHQAVVIASVDDGLLV